MADLLWLPDALRAAGLEVFETAGWRTRETRPGFGPLGVVCHHTATSTSVSDETMRRILINGRADLRGPLAQCGLRRDGTWDIIAAGRCNHNGYGKWGNDSIGVEAYNDGKGEPWPKAQLDSYTRGVAAICAHYQWGAHRVKGHKETDPTRKIDPVGIDMAKFRRTVTTLNTPPPPPSEPETDMAKLVKGSSTPNWYITDGITKRFVNDRAEGAALVYAGFATWDNGEAFVLDQAVVNDIRTV